MISHNRYAMLEELVFQHEICTNMKDQDGAQEMERQMMACVTPALLIEMINELERLENQVLEAKERG